MLTSVIKIDLFSLLLLLLTGDKGSTEILWTPKWPWLIPGLIRQFLLSWFSFSAEKSFFEHFRCTYSDCVWKLSIISHCWHETQCPVWLLSNNIMINEEKPDWGMSKNIFTWIQPSETWEKAVFLRRTYFLQFWEMPKKKRGKKNDVCTVLRFADYDHKPLLKSQHWKTSMKKKTPRRSARL